MNKFYGFSLAEILITLVILGFVGALGVPMIGQQKLKKPNTFAKHGLFECYYDVDGQLKQHFVNNTDHKRDEYKVADGDSCYFAVPASVNFFTLQVIGAGGNGGITNARYTSVKLTDDDGAYAFDSGSVAVDSSFQESLSKAPSWVKRYWDQQWTRGASKPRYTLSSSSGNGGDGSCGYIRYTSSYRPGCAEGGNEMPPEDPGCIEWHGGTGGRGGSGVKYTFSIPVYSTYNISMTNSSISFGNGMSASVNGGGSNGGNATKITNTQHKNGTNGTNSGSGSITGISSYSTSYISGGSGGSGCCGKDTANPYGCYGGSGSSGGSSVSPASISYKGEIPGVDTYYSKAGEAGNSVMKVYERLPVSSLKLTPAKSVIGGADTTIYYKKQGEEEYAKRLLKIKASDDGEVVAGDRIRIQIDKEQDFPFPSKRYPYEFAPKNPAIEVAKTNFTSKVAELMTNEDFRPGKSGAGSFPILGKIDVTLDLVLNSIRFASSGLINYTSDAAAFECPYGAEKATNSLGKYYCKETMGNPGAIVISW